MEGGNTIFLELCLKKAEDGLLEQGSCSLLLREGPVKGGQRDLSEDGVALF
jgi:hypothetical protein